MLFVCEYNRGTQEVILKIYLLKCETQLWNSNLKLDSNHLKLQVTYLKNFSLFVEPKVETLGIQEHVSLGRTLVSWQNIHPQNIHTNIHSKYSHTKYSPTKCNLHTITRSRAQVTGELLDNMLEGASRVGSNPKVFLRRIFPVQVGVINCLKVDVSWML